ncbi:MAG: LPS assembly lipoprotein LptE [Gammaproteobacteria bacterium]
MNLIRIALLILTVSMLLSCGFQLRGSQHLPAVMQKTFVKAEVPYSSMSTAMRNQLQAIGIEVPSIDDNATATIQILSHRSDRRVLSVGSSGKATEYELFEEIKFRLLDAQQRELIEPQVLRVTRDYVFDETRLLGKFQEADQIREQMREELAQRVLSRIETRLQQKNGPDLP